jgi:hypothetical protein
MPNIPRRKSIYYRQFRQWHLHHDYTFIYSSPLQSRVRFKSELCIRFLYTSTRNISPDFMNILTSRAITWHLSNSDKRKIGPLSNKEELLLDWLQENWQEKEFVNELNLYIRKKTGDFSDTNTLKRYKNSEKKLVSLLLEFETMYLTDYEHKNNILNVLKQYQESKTFNNSFHERISQLLLSL